MLLTKRIWGLLVLLIISITGFSQPAASVIDSLIGLINEETYRQHFDSLRTGEGCFRKVIEGANQSTDHDACRDYIFRSLKNYLGEKNTTIQPFEARGNKGLANVLGIKYGTNPEAGCLIISAHYDSNNNRGDETVDCSPGANDNGTGIAAVLEIARIVSSIETECSVIFAAWDLEEQFIDGFGSGSNEWFKAHIKTERRKRKSNNPEIMSPKDIIANINFDMFGNPQDTIDGKPVLWACTANTMHKSFVDDYVATFEQYIPAIKAINKGKMTYSDHYTFGARKVPAVENLESGYEKDPFYHTCSDNLKNAENINFEFAVNVTRGGFAFILEKVLAQKKEDDSAPSF